MSEMSTQKLSYNKTPKKGDLVIFDFSGRHTAHTHIGLVTEVINSSTFKTIEGNTGSRDYTNGGYVLSQTRYISQVNCFIRPAYSKDIKKTALVTEKASVYESPYKDPVKKSSKVLKTLKKGAKVTLVENSDDGWGWSKVKSGSITGWIMNKHLSSKELSPFKEFTLKADTSARPIVNKTLKKPVTLKKGTSYILICEIEDGEYKGQKYIAVNNKRYYI